MERDIQVMRSLQGQLIAASLEGSQRDLAPASHLADGRRIRHPISSVRARVFDGRAFRGGTAPAADGGVRLRDRRQDPIESDHRGSRYGQNAGTARTFPAARSEFTANRLSLAQPHGGYVISPCIVIRFAPNSGSRSRTWGPA
jgi:hypothetical protein